MNIELATYINFEEYYLRYVPKAKRMGDELVGQCPFHDDRHPSFAANIKTGLWRCFASCGGGNIVSFHARYYNLTTKEAFRDLCKKYNIPLSQKKQKSISQGSKKGIPVSELESFNEIPEKALKFLVKKRGWSPEIIKKYKIGFDSKDYRFTIPIFDEDGTLVNIRRYQPGAKENKILSWKRGYGKSRLFPISVLQDARSQNIPVVITEGEPDCLCGLSHGLLCITQTAGAGTWKDTFNPLFKDLKVIIAYDNDDEGSKGAEKVAKNLPLFATSVEIIQWPEFMGYKEDLTDFFVKYGKTAEDFHSLPRKKVAKPQTDPDTPGVEKKDGAYWSLSYTRNGVIRKKISNFTIQITHNFERPDGVVRGIKLIRENGPSSMERELSPSDMISKQAFSHFCLKAGNFIWKGSTSDLEQIWEMELEANDGRMIYQPDRVGWIQEEGLWLFSDCVIKNGIVYFPDENGIIWVEDKGYKPLRFGIDESIYSSIPSIRYDLSDEIIDDTRKKLIRLLKQNIGGFEAYLGLGFVAACVYYPEIFVRYRFPILSVFGRPGSGKNTFVSILMSFFGLDESMVFSVDKITKVGLTRLLSYYSAVPVWGDEYKNTRECKEKDEYLKSAFDRTGKIQGHLGFGVRSYPVNAPLIISGEGFSSDSALTSRCILIQLSQKKRRDDLLPKIKSLLPKTSGILAKLIKEKNDKKVASLFQEIEITKEALEKQGFDPRLAGIYAAVAECFANLLNFDDVNQDMDEFGEWLLKEAHRAKDEKEEKFILNEFFEDLEVLRNSHCINGNHVEIIKKNINGEVVPYEIRIWLKGAFNAWAYDYRKRGKEPCTYQDLKKYLKEEDYFIEEKTMKINGLTRKGVCLNPHKLPTDLLNIFYSGWNDSS